MTDEDAGGLGDDEAAVNCSEASEHCADVVDDVDEADEEEDKWLEVEDIDNGCEGTGLMGPVV